MKKILLYCIYVLWAVIILANVLRFCGIEAMVAVLGSVQEPAYLTRQLIKGTMYYIELTATMAIITRGRTPKILIVGAVGTFLAIFVATNMENLYMNILLYCVVIILYTKDQKAAFEEMLIVCGLYIVYGFLTQLGRFTLDWANYKNYTVQLLSCVDYKALPILGFLYSKYYGQERRLSLCGKFRAARCSSVTKILRCGTSADADSSK